MLGEFRDLELPQHLFVLILLTKQGTRALRNQVENSNREAVPRVTKLV